MPSKLPERNKTILRRLAKLGLDLVAAYTARKNEAKNKKINLFKEKKTDILKQDLTTEDYLGKIEDGVYDDGYAVICGIIRRGDLSGFKFCYLDIDKKEGVEAFCDYGDRKITIEELANNQYVEFNGIDRDERIHIPYILTDTANISAKGADDILGIEVNTNGVMFAAGSPHHNGRYYQQLGKSDKIKILDQTLAFALQDHITSLCSRHNLNYFTGHDKEQKAQFYEAYTKNLHDDGTRIKKGGRHEIMKFICCSYFNKYEGEWDNLTDDQRFERVLGYDLMHCDPPLYETDPQEVRDLWSWNQKTFRVSRDSAKEKRDFAKRKTEEKYKDDLKGLSEEKQQLFKSYNVEVQGALSGNVWTELEKDNWILADRRENIIYKSYLIDKEIGDIRLVVFVKGARLLKCVPISMTRHEMPLEFLNSQATYTMTFRNTLGKTFILSRKTIDQITDWLKNEGYILPTAQRAGTLTQIISAMIDAFREDGKLETDRSISAMGIYYLDGKLVFVGLDEYLDGYNKQTVQERKEAIDFIGQLITKFRPGIISTALKVGVISPFNFALKQYTDDIVYIRSLFPYGWPRTGKSAVAMLPAGMYFKYGSPSRKVPFTSINSEAR